MATATAPPGALHLKAAETLKTASGLRPRPTPTTPASPGQPRTSARLVLQGAHPLNIDLGKFAGQPGVVDAAKARQAGFPSGLLLGFRSYSAATGTMQDLAVLSVNGHRLRIVQRRVAETAATPGPFETAREIPLPGNTRVVAAPAK